MVRVNQDNTFIWQNLKADGTGNLQYQPHPIIIINVYWLDHFSMPGSWWDNNEWDLEREKQTEILEGTIAFTFFFFFFGKFIIWPCLQTTRFVVLNSLTGVQGWFALTLYLKCFIFCELGKSLIFFELQISIKM